MDLPHELVASLDLLSAALEDGDDLAAILEVLTDDLTAAVPSFLGLTLTMIIDGETVALHVPEPIRHSRSSVSVPLSATASDPAAALILYAALSGALDALGVEARSNFASMDQVVIDGHLVPFDGHPELATVLAQNADINQAIGVLIDQGHTPERSRTELRGRADAAGIDLSSAARLVLTALPTGRRPAGTG